MSRLAARLIAICCGTLLSTAGIAQSTPIDRAVSALPDTVAGMTRVYDETTGKPLVVYSGKLGSDPIIAIAFAEIRQPTAPVAVRQLARGDAEMAGILKTLFEGRFSVRDRPLASTFFGEYLTERGLKQAWLIEDAGLRTIVSATIYRMEDRGKVFDEVRVHLLTGATMIKEPPMAASRKTDR